VWSCGVVLYMMIAREVPFEYSDGAGPPGMQNGSFPWPPSMDPELRGLICAMLQPDPTKRWSISKIKESAWYRRPTMPQDQLTLRMAEHMQNSWVEQDKHEIAKLLQSPSQPPRPSGEAAADHINAIELGAAALHRLDLASPQGTATTAARHARQDVCGVEGHMDYRDPSARDGSDSTESDVDGDEDSPVSNGGLQREHPIAESSLAEPSGEQHLEPEADSDSCSASLLEPAAMKAAATTGPDKAVLGSPEGSRPNVSLARRRLHAAKAAVD
jgi:serine/threonine protein kinase